MGQRDFYAESDGCSMGYKSGTNVEGGFTGSASMIKQGENCAVFMNASGGASDPTDGHKSTVESIEKAGDAAGKVISEGASGAVRGFAASSGIGAAGKVLGGGE